MNTFFANEHIEIFFLLFNETIIINYHLSSINAILIQLK